MSDDLVRYSKKKLMRILLFPLRLLPIKKNRIMMYNSLAKYSCNPKYLTEYLLKNYPKELDIIYTVNNEEISSRLKKRGVKCVKPNTPQYFYYTMTSNVCVTNSGGYSYVPLKKKQVVINTHHGGGAYKKVGLHVYGNGKYFRKDLLLASKQTTKFISTSKKFTKCLSSAMLIDEDKFWEIGMPRNDQLINNNPDVSIDEIRNKINLKSDERLVLFAPTYRKINDNYFNDSISIDYGLDYKRVCEALEKKFGGKWKFAYRYHPSIINSMNIKNDDVLDLSSYEDMQELLLVTDVLINDFSSSIWDFMLTKKPCFMFAIDMDHYIKTTDVYTPVGEWPMSKARTNDELINNILNFDYEQYRLNIQKHYEDLGGCESGQATKMIGDYIYEQCKS